LGFDTRSRKYEGSLHDSTAHQAREETIETTKKRSNNCTEHPLMRASNLQAGPTTVSEATSQALLRIWGYRAGHKNPGMVEEKFSFKELFKNLEPF